MTTSSHRPPHLPRRNVLAVLLVTVLALGTGVGAAQGYWTATSTTGGGGASAATTVNAGETPTASASGAAVTVSWAASALASGQAVSGYRVSRYDANSSTLQPVLPGCAGVITATSCVEQFVPTGAWTYSVTPVIGTNWRGNESAKSAAVIAESAPPANSLALSGLSGGAWMSGSTIYYRGASAGSFTLTNGVTDAYSGPASSTTALGGITAGWSHTPSTVSAPSGGPYVSNPFAWAAATTSAPTATVSARDKAGNTATTNLSFVNDSVAPTAGSVSYVNGSTGGNPITVSFTTGTDTGSGIATRVLQRADATLSGINCGSYGAFATVTGGSNPTSPYVDTVPIDQCHKYRYVVTDRVGNTHEATSANVARSPYGSYWALDAGTGTTAVDSSGNSNTATLQAAAGWTTGRFGAGALSLTATNTSWMSAPDPVIDTSQSYSVSTWVKLNTLTGFQTFASVDGTNISPFYLQLNNAGRFRLEQTAADAVGGAGSASILGLAPTTGVWYHLVGTYDKTANTIQLYVNGTLQGTTTATTAWKASGTTAVGRAKYAGAPVDFVNGAIDEVRFFDRAITPAEVVALRGTLGAHWAFDEGVGSVAIDSTGTFHPGTLGSAAGWTTGRVGTNALSLNATVTSNVTVNTPVIDTSNSYSVATWVRLNSLAGTQTFTSVDGANISPFYLQLAGGTFGFLQHSADITTSPHVQVKGLAPTIGTWYHVAGVYNKTNNTIQLFVNGISQGSTTATTAWQATGQTALGRARYAAGPVDYVNGALDDVRFYDRAITATEVAALAAQ